jgi:hypothetical protein
MVGSVGVCGLLTNGQTYPKTFGVSGAFRTLGSYVFRWPIRGQPLNFYFVGNFDFLLLFLPVFRCLDHSYCLHPRSGVYELCAPWPKRQR